MKSTHLFQILVLLTLLFSSFGANQPVRASTSAVDKPDIRNIDRNFPGFQDEPNVSVLVSQGSVHVGEMTTVTVSLNHVPAEGYTSAELTCTYDPDVVEASNLVIGNLFGLDPVTAINGPHNGQFIVAIAGSAGKKAISSGVVLAFNVRGLQAGQSPLGCQARVSTGDSALTRIDSTSGNIMIVGNVPTPSTTAAMRITIDPGQTTASRIGIVNPNETIRYLLNATAGQVLSIQVTAPANEVALGVNGPTGLALKPLDASLTWSATITTSGDHTITLMALTGSSSKPYTLVVSLTTPAATVAPTATPTFKPTPCDKAEFVADVNVRPGTVMSPGAQFIKTWRLKNVGSCTWTISYRLAFLSGDLMGAPSSIQLFRDVPPGATVDLSLPMTASSDTGSHRGYWIFQNSTGQPFGVGSQGNEPWFVDILVANSSVTPTPTQPSSILKLTKIASSQTYAAPDQTITYTFTITNTGTTALGPAQFTITDTKLGAPFNCGPADLILAPNQSVTCSSAYKTTSADMARPNIINSATASGAGQTSAVATAVVTNLAAPATPSEEPYFTPTPNGSFTPTSTSVPTTGTVTGQVLAGKQVILDLFDADNWPVAVAFANADGTFSLTAPAGTYNLVARAPGFLSALGPVTIPAGGITSKPTITLLPGDIDSNFVINWLDVVTIGINYNNSYPSEADLNNDGIINVLDLELLAKNYRMIGPVDW